MQPSPHLVKNRFIAAISLLVLLSIFLVAHTQADVPRYACKGLSCLESGGTSIPIPKNQDQTFTIKFTIDRNVVSQAIDRDVQSGSVEYENENHKASIYLPMRGGAAKYFGVSIPPKIENIQQIEIVVDKSRILHIFLNKKILYTHRYTYPVYYISNLSGLEKSGIRKIQKFELISYQSNRFWSNFLIALWFIPFIIFWKLLTNVSVQKYENTWFRKHWIKVGFLVATIWIIRAAYWFKNPADKTGNLSPTPFGPAGPFFSDIFQVVQAGRFSRAYDYSATGYPPLITAISRLMNLVPDGIKVFSITTFTVVVWSYVINFFRNKSNKNTFPPTSILILTLPILFAIARGNLDLLAIGLIGLGIVHFQQNKIIFAVAALTFASALKYWPILTLLFLVNKIGKKNFCFIALFSAILTVLSSLVCGYRGFSSVTKVIFSPLAAYSYSSGSSQLAYSYSIFFITFLIGIFKYSKNFMHPSHVEIDAALRLLSPFESRVLIIMIVIGFLLLNTQMKRLSSNVLIGSGAALLVTGTSYTYRASILVLVLLLRIAFDKEYFRYAFKQAKSMNSKRVNWSGVFEILLWGTLLLPIDFIYARDSLISITSLVQPIALILIIAQEVVYFRLALFNLLPNRIRQQKTF